MKNVVLFLLMTCCLVSCDISTSYTVYVRNSTGEDLTIAYKAQNDVRGMVEETIVLKDGAAETIIRTHDLEVVEGSAGEAPKPCEFVADYMTFTIRGNIESKLKWCDPAIKLETMDIGQDEFGLEFILADFPVE